MATLSTLSLWTEILNSQRKTRMMAIEAGLPQHHAARSLSFTEGLVLHLIHSVDQQSIKDLADILGLERSWVSRVVGQLEKDNFVESVPSEHDRRSRLISITKRGIKTLEALGTNRSPLMTLYLKSLSQSEQKKLFSTMEDFASRWGAPKCVQSSETHPFDSALVRLSWQAGTVGYNFMQSELSVTQYQVLYELATSSQNLSASDLFEVLPFDMSTISRTIQGFEKDGTLTKIPSKQDKRSFTVTLTKDGKKRWNHCCQLVSDILQPAVSALSNEVEKVLIPFLHRCNEPKLMRQRNMPSARIQVTPFSPTNPDKAAQAFLNKKQNKLPSRSKLFEQCYAISFDDELKAVAQTTHQEKEGELTDFSFTSEGLNEQECVQLVRSVLSGKFSERG
ncbi:MAG: MarR family transcriptional regulator [Bdellovibrionales bacterium]|nr:MarR family transcriptional regulator [Bdellovibrionales bacterium]